MMRVKFYRSDHRLVFDSASLEPLPAAAEWCDLDAEHHYGPCAVVLIDTITKACAYHDYLTEQGHEVVGDVFCLFGVPSRDELLDLKARFESGELAIKPEDTTAE